MTVVGLLSGFGDSRLYNFTTATFTSGGVTSYTGPSLAQAQSGMTGTPTPNTWNTNTSFFNVSSGIQLWTVPKTGTYRLTLKGASGGGNTTGTYYPADPGEGATIICEVFLNKETILNLVVGQRPGTTTATNQNGSAGGGGSWIYTGVIGGSGLIAVAGGGGGWGHGSAAGGGGNGLGGSATNDSRRVNSGTVINGKPGNGTGATNGVGNGGGLATVGSFGGASGGAGWLSNGSNRTTDNTSNGGTRFTGGTSAGGTALYGGFGGGGGANGNGVAGGGGGGYTGGPASNDWNGTYWGNAGGGGSYWTGTLVSATQGRDGGAFLRSQAENGYITITAI